MEQGAAIQALALGKSGLFCQIWKKKNSVCGNHLCFPAVPVLLSASLQPRSVQLKLEVIISLVSLSLLITPQFSCLHTSFFLEHPWQDRDLQPLTLPSLSQKHFLNNCALSPQDLLSQKDLLLTFLDSRSHYPDACTLSP